MVIDCSLPVFLSLADTFKIPSESISSVTSIWGVPLGAASIPSRLNWPNDLLALATSRSPWSTCTVTADWLSAAVEKVWEAFVGMVVFFSISLVITPPIVSIPKDNGVTSSNNTSLTSPPNTPAWIAAPIATASSGLTSFLGSLPKNSLTFSRTLGILVEPPTMITSSMSLAVSLASSSATWHGSIERWIRSATNDSSFARVILMFMCLGPEASAVTYGRFTSVCSEDDNSILAFSAASFKRWSAIGSFFRLTPCSLLNSSTK